jgi:F-type H+-transporting ATPase subunit gamma
MKIIKRRIASVSNTKQIMKAMDLVATSKLQRIQIRLNAIRPLFDETKRVMGGVKDFEGKSTNIFLKSREVKNTAYIVITSDRGLCGGYNVNVSKAALSHMLTGKREKMITVGLKGWEYFNRRRKNILQRYVGVSETALFDDAERIGGLLSSLYKSGEIDEAYVAYTHFESMLSHVPRVEKILPVGGSPTTGGIMQYEPDIDTYLEEAIPTYLSVFIHGAMVESNACEQASRMMSMDSAANNAAEIIEGLTLEYNRKRQSIITQEITEIVSGANALQ